MGYKYQLQISKMMQASSQSQWHKGKHSRTRNPSQCTMIWPCLSGEYTFKSETQPILIGPPSPLRPPCPFGLKYWCARYCVLSQNTMYIYSNIPTHSWIPQVFQSCRCIPRGPQVYTQHELTLWLPQISYIPNAKEDSQHVGSLCRLNYLQGGNMLFGTRHMHKACNDCQVYALYQALHEPCKHKLWSMKWPKVTGDHIEPTTRHTRRMALMSHLW